MDGEKCGYILLRKSKKLERRKTVVILAVA